MPGHSTAASGIVCSMSRSGNVWDKAAMESFFYIATRRHSTIGYPSPVEFERKVGLA
jgi:putative transposase